MNTLRIVDLTTTYGPDTFSVRKLNLSIQAGNVALLVGANGSGKSTVLKALVGLVRVVSGEVKQVDVDQPLDFKSAEPSPASRGELRVGLSASRKSTVRSALVDVVRDVFAITDPRNVGCGPCFDSPDAARERGVVYLPQGQGVFGRLTVRENLSAAALSVPRKDREVLIDKVLKDFPQFRDRFDQTAETLSGGERQALSLAMAAFPTPKFLLLDEPTAGLSTGLARQHLDRIRALAHKKGIGILLVEHRLREAVRIADSVHVIVDGEMSAPQSRAEFESVMSARVQVRSRKAEPATANRRGSPRGAGGPVADCNAYRFDYNDEPSEDDLLDHKIAAITFGRHLSKIAPPVVAAILGPWGSGKTTFLKMVATELASLSNSSPVARYDADASAHYTSVPRVASGQPFRGCFVAEFNPWLFQGSANIVKDLLMTIHVAAEKARVVQPEARRVFRALLRELDKAETGSLFEAILLNAGGALSKSTGTLASMFSSLTNWSFPIGRSRAFVRGVADAHYMMTAYFRSLLSDTVLIVDELDRCQPDRAVAVLEAVHHFLSTPNMSIRALVAIDPDITVRAINKKYGFTDWQDGWRYLGKTCNFFYFIPRTPEGKYSEILVNDEARRETEFRQSEKERGRDRKSHNYVEVLHEVVKSDEAVRLWEEVDAGLPRQLKHFVRHTSMMVSEAAHNVLGDVDEYVTKFSVAAVHDIESTRLQLMRFLLGLVIFRGMYPTLYQVLVQRLAGAAARSDGIADEKTNVEKNLVDLLIDLGIVSKNRDDKARKGEAIKCLARYGVLDMMELGTNDVLLKRCGVLFGVERIVRGTPRRTPGGSYVLEFGLQEYCSRLQTEVLRPAIDQLMSR